MATFKFVLIPADPSAPLVERIASSEGGLDVDDLKVRIREHFATVHSGGGVSEDAVADARLADVRAEAGGMAGVTEAMLAAAAASGRDVNILLLSAPVKPACLSVSLYSDADAERKGLAVNARATALAHASGHAASNVLRGDVFAARTHDDDAADIWSRVDLAASEAVPSAPWVLAAAGANSGRSLSSYSTGGALQALTQQAAAGVAPAQGLAPLPEGAGGAAGDRPPGPWAPEPSPNAPEGPVRPPTTGVSTANTEWVQCDGGKYAWRTTAWGKEMEVRVPVPPGTKGKNLSVVLTNTRIGIALKAAKTPGEVGGSLATPGGLPLTGKIAAEDCLWEIDEDAAAGTAWVTFTLILVRRMGAPFWTSLTKEAEAGGGAAGGAATV